MDGKIFTVPCFKDMSSIQLFDLLDCGKEHYDYLLLENLFRLYKEYEPYSYYFNVSLYVGNFRPESSYVASILTASLLKKLCANKEYTEKHRNGSVLIDALYNALDEMWEKDDNSWDVSFKKPILISAQNSDIRSNIGCNGIKYGETKLYAIYGVRFSVFFRF